MRLVFTKLQEEVTTGKKSVTQLQVETGSSDFKAVEPPVIELRQDARGVERPLPTNPSRTSPMHTRKALPALYNTTEQVTDVVDLHRSLPSDSFGPVTYSISGFLGRDTYLGREANQRFSEESVFVAERVSGCGDQVDTSKSLMQEERARYELTARRFLATQDLVKYHSTRSFTIDIVV
jgi:hypothetical protein